MEMSADSIYFFVCVCLETIFSESPSVTLLLDLTQFLKWVKIIFRLNFLHVFSE